jgi:D-arginine dehydrogenase
VRAVALTRLGWYEPKVDELPRDASLVIVGGGFAGAATAWWLARAGVERVVVIEREAICGAHASGKNAALCRQIADDDDTTVLTARGAAFLRQPPDGFAPVPLYARTGGILTADDDAGLDALCARAAAHGIAHERVAMADVAARWPQASELRAAGGVYVPDDGVIDVGALLAGFVAGARRAGARVVTSCELRAVTPRGDRVTIETTRGAIDADAVVAAAGAWAGVVGALAGSAARFTPIKRHLFVTQPPARPAGGPWLWHLGREPFYLRREGIGLLVSHCDARAVPPADVAPDDDAKDALAERIRRAAPGFSGLEVTRAWACLRTFAPDHRMQIGFDADAPWLFWVAALGGHGATAAAAVGERAASLLRR